MVNVSIVGELDDELGYDKYDVGNKKMDNTRNSYGKPVRLDRLRQHNRRITDKILPMQLTPLKIIYTVIYGFHSFCLKCVSNNSSYH